MTRRALIAFAAALLTMPAGASGQEARPQGREAPSIDVVTIEREDLFTDAQVETNPFAGFFNGLHVTTQVYVIRRELLFDAGDPADSIVLAESERNLRSRGLFRSVRIDTVTVDDLLTARVRTRDAWSLLPRASFQIAADGRLTGSFGLTETNVGGTGNRVRLWYVREADRDGLVAGVTLPQIGRSNLAASGSLASLSDLDSGSWTFASPFRANSDTQSFFYGGEAFTGRVTRYRAESASVADTTDFHRRATINRFFYTLAPRARPEGYLRVGASIEVRREEYLLADTPELDQDSIFALVPDTVYSQLSVYGEYRRSRFVRLGRFNGFTEEDQDLSDLVYLSAALAPGGLGYERTGIGPRLVVRSGLRAGPALLKGVIDANALFNSAGLDSGRVVATGTAAIRTGERHATFLQLAGGVLEHPPPGGEFDLGFQQMPRLWGPHAFVGTRSLRATVEHRFFAIDNIADLVGIGLAGFFDYGGAWYDDQDARLGGNAGVSIFFGSPLSSLAQVSHLSGGYRFGGGIDDSSLSRWAFSLGAGLIF
ncbi:MAG: hypothetical protein R3195_09595 [Gemmatimonadota bacterium]|nr:hypothetical protein [Gemmatimonadota bacterium]